MCNIALYGAVLGLFGGVAFATISQTVVADETRLTASLPSETSIVIMNELDEAIKQHSAAVSAQILQDIQNNLNASLKINAQ